MRKKKVLHLVPRPLPRHQRLLWSKDCPKAHLRVLQEEPARDHLDLRHALRPRGLQPIATNEELQARLNHAEPAYRSWMDPDEE